ncbi:MAG: ABC transporter ATP-binding protein [Syntrophotaleaceae bacterium]
MKRGMFDLDEMSGRHLDWTLFRRFLALLRPYRRAAMGALLLLPLVTVSRLVQPYLVKVAIDQHIVPARLEGLGMVAVLYLLAVCSESLFGFGQGYLAQVVGQRLMAGLRERSFRHLLRLPAGFFDRNPSGRLVTRLTGDVENVGELFGSGVAAALGEIFSLVFIVGIMFWLNLRLTLVAFALVPLLVGILLLFRRSMRGAMRQVRARVAGLNGYLAERIAGINEVRLYGQEKRTLEEFGELQRMYRSSSFRSIHWDAFLFSALEILSSLAIAGILWVGGGAVLAETATFGTLVAFVEYVQRFYAPLRKLSAQYSLLQSSNASLERIFALMDETPEIYGTGDWPKGDTPISLEKVSFAYDGKNPVLKDIDLTIAPGETVALVGDTGSGKTTLTRLLLRFYEPDSGRIRINGIDLSEIDSQRIRKQVAWVSQEPFLFAGSLRENLDPENCLSDRDLQKLIVGTGCEDSVRRLGGLQGVITERGRNLSAGERQLLCLVRALALNPKLMIFDEATSRLDGVTEELVQREMARAGQGRTSLIIAHRLRSIRHADRIVVLHHGRIRESGTHQELLAAGGLYSRLWRLQELTGEGRAAESAAFL